MIVNGALAFIWLIGFSLLSWWMSGTLTHVCNVANWHEDAGIMVCRIYKSLFTFSLLGVYVATYQIHASFHIHSPRAC